MILSEECFETCLEHVFNFVKIPFCEKYLKWGKTDVAKKSKEK